MEALALRPTPPLIVWMSSRLAIPWRVALQHGPEGVKKTSNIVVTNCFSQVIFRNALLRFEAFSPCEDH
jgi:hypothetical protein